MKGFVAVVGLTLLGMLKVYECGVISQSLIAQLEWEQNADTTVDNDELVPNLLVRLKREPGTPIDDDSKSQEHPPPPPPNEHGHHLIDHMMHEIHHGHVTQEKISHWWKELQTALEHGSLDMDDVNQFINTLKETHNFDGDHCCLFG